jgi:hypothetical protein
MNYLYITRRFHKFVSAPLLLFYAFVFMLFTQLSNEFLKESLF